MTIATTPEPTARIAKAIKSPAEAGTHFRREGFVVGPPVIPADLLRRAAHGMDEVMAGRYETGVKPLDGWWKPADDPAKNLRKIDQSHVSNRAIAEIITYPALGKWIAAAIGAKFLQVWCLQLLHKPGAGGSAGRAANVGWHQDYHYWRNWYTPDSEIFTCWLAVSDVPETSGPMRFVARSHTWGLLEGSDFFGTGDAEQRSGLPVPPETEWVEHSAVMPAGAFSLHHRLTLHGSGPNISRQARRSFAIHLRTDRSTPTLGKGMNPTDPERYDYVSFLKDPAICPVIYLEGADG